MERQKKEIRQAFRDCRDTEKKYEARRLRRRAQGKFGKAKIDDFNTMVIGTRGKKKVKT